MITTLQLRSASDGTAWKTSSMRGYLFKSVAKGEGATGFWLVFVPAGAGTISISPTTGEVTASSGTITCFKCKTDGTPDAWGSSDPNYNVKTDLDAELLGHVLTAQWQQSNQVDCETARVGASGGKW